MNCVCIAKNPWPRGRTDTTHDRAYPLILVGRCGPTPAWFPSNPPSNATPSAHERSRERDT
eukprot:6155376-Prymnesium_polylepis.1